MSFITGEGTFSGGGFIAIGSGPVPTPTYSSFSISSQSVGSQIVLSVTSTSNAPIVYTSSNKIVASITSPNILNVLSAGTVTITASQIAFTNPDGTKYLAGFTSTTFTVTVIPTTVTNNLSLVFSPTVSSAATYNISGNASISTINGYQVFSLSGNGTITVNLGTVTRDFARAFLNPIVGNYSISFLLFYNQSNTTESIVLNDNNNPNYLFGFNASNRSFNMYINHSTKTTATIPSDLTINQWNHFLITYDGNTVLLYVNGTLATMANNTGITSAVDVNPLILGSSGIIPSFVGFLNNVLIYNAALTQSTVTQISTFENQSQIISNIPNTVAPTSVIQPTFSNTIQLYNLYQLLGYTLVVCSQTLANNANQRVFEFNNASITPTEYLYASPYTSGTTQVGLNPGNGTTSTNFTSVLNTIYVYTMYFPLDANNVVINAYSSNANGNLTSKLSQSYSYTNTINTFLSDCSNIWFGKSGTTTNNYYNGSYSQICLYNGNLNTDASYSLLQNLVATPFNNTINSNNTYTFGAYTGFIPVTVTLNNNGNSGYLTASNTSVLLNGTSTTAGGYMSLSSFSITTTVQPNGLGQVYAIGNNQAYYGVNATLSGNLTSTLVNKYSPYFNGKIMKNIVMTYFGTIFIDSMNHIHACGSVNGLGQVSGNNNQFLAPADFTNVGSFKGATITKIITSEYCGLALDSSGNVHGFGNDRIVNAFGQGTLTYTTTPFNISTSTNLNSIYNRPIVSMAIGSYSTIYVDSSGYVHTVGYGYTANNPIPTTTTRTQNISVVGASSGTNVAGSSLIGAFITSVYTTYTGGSQFALDASGNVHTWGSNYTAGQLAYGNNTAGPNLPVNVSNLSNLVLYKKKIVSITTNLGNGGSGVLFLDNSGLLYSFQSSIYDQQIPVIVQNLIGGSLYNKKVISMSSGSNAYYAVDSNGQLHGWSLYSTANPNGIGDGTVNNYTLPVNLTTSLSSALYGKQINSIYESGVLLAIVSGTATYIAPATIANYQVVNKAFSFGTTNGGLYGNGTTAAVSNTMNQSMTGFGDLSWNHDNVVNIYPGVNCVFLLDSSGYVYMCNSNTSTNNQTLLQGVNTSPFLISNFGSLDGPFITSLAVGYYTTYALDSIGKLHAWGGYSNSLGYGSTTTTSSIPICISDLSTSSLYGKTITQIYAFGGSSNTSSAMAIDSSGTNYVWGYLNSSNLPVITNPLNPIFSIPLPIQVTQITSGNGYTVLDNYGIVYDNNIGYPTTKFNVPIVSIPTTNNASHMGAIDICGNVWMWGSNNVGQLGNNTLVNSTTIPINISQIAGSSLYGKKVISLTTSKYDTNPATIAIDTSGNVHFWGSSNLLTTSNQKLPVLISTAYTSLSGQVDIVATLGQATGYLALNYSNAPTKSLWAVSNPVYGSTVSLYPPLTASPAPYSFYSSNPLVASVAGNTLQTNSVGSATITMYQYASGTYSPVSSSTVVNVQNALYTAGNSAMLYGNNSSNADTYPNIVAGWNGYGDLSSNGKYIVKIVNNDSYGSTALDNSGNVYVCTSNASTSAFYIVNGTANGNVPNNVMSKGSLLGTTIVDIAASTAISYAIDTSGNLHGWGNGTGYGIGDGTSTARNLPINLSLITTSAIYGKKIKQISVCSSNGSTSYALDTSNNVYSWGYNGYYQLGTGDNTTYYTPQNITSKGSLQGVTIVQVCAGAQCALALDASGQVHYAGSNNVLNGIGTFINVSIIPGSSLNNAFVPQLTVNGDGSSILIDSLGNIHAWGSGIIGNGLNTTNPVFVNLCAITNSAIYGKQIAFAAWRQGTCFAIDTTGKKYIWGYGAGFGTPDSTLPYCIDPSCVALQNKTVVYADMMNIGYSYLHFITRNTSASYSVSPTSIPNMQLWLDAQDISTMTLNGSLVTQWNDKSGMGRNATPYQSGNPSLSSTAFQGSPAVVMDVNQAMSCPIPSGTFSSGMTCFVVFQDTSMNIGTTNPLQTLVSRTSSGTPAPFDIQNNTRYTGNGVYDTTFFNIGLANGYNLLSFTVQSGQWQEYVNGALNYTSTTMNTFSDTASSFYIGSNDTGTTGFTGSIAEIMVYSGILSTNQRQSLEGYLAYKWNVVSQMPWSHPYFNLSKQTLFQTWTLPTKTYGTDVSFSLVGPVSSSPGSIAYGSSNAAVATVTLAGVVTIVGPGTTTITAMQQPSGAYMVGSTTATLTVLSNQVLSLFGGTLAPTMGAFTLPTTLVIGQTYTITPPASTSRGAFSYTSSNPTVANIVGNNSFLYIASGVTIITATQAAYGGYASLSVSSTINTTTFNYTTTATVVLSNVVDSTDGNTYTNFIFTANGNIQLTSLEANKNVYLLAVGGGGGGGNNIGGNGGGGAGGGGYVQTRIYPSSTDTITVTVGSGGASASSGMGSNGGNTTVVSSASNISLTAYGGGGGGGNGSIPTGTVYGSTGGAGRDRGVNDYLAVTQTTSQNIGNGNVLAAMYQGYHGGASIRSGWGGGGGGGGAGAVGGDGNGSGGANNTIPGPGGNGAQYTLNGMSSTYKNYYWAGGGGSSNDGGAGSTLPAGNGGLGGGGGGLSNYSGTNSTGGGSALNSGQNGAVTGGNGGANTGGGGGGLQNGCTGGNGGSGIVILMVQQNYLSDRSNIMKSIKLSQNNFLSVSSTLLPATTNVFTIEMWFYPTDSGTSYPWILGDINGASFYWLLGINNNKLDYFSGNSSGGLGTQTVSNNSVTLNQWNHIVFTSDGIYFYFYINGVRDSVTIPYSNRYGTYNNTIIGQDTFYGNVNGYLTNLRFTNTQVYGPSSSTYNFIVPTTPLTSIQGTSFLMQYNGTNFIDNSPNQYTIVKQGSPAVNSISPFFS